MKQGSPEWFKAREGMVTGSRAAGILGLNPYQTRDDVMRLMVREAFGKPQEFTGNMATEWGKVYEPVARQDAEIDLDVDIDETGFIVHPEHTWIGASPDGLISTDGGIEIKCPYSKKIRGEVPKMHLPQINLCMECTDRDSWYYYQWTPEVSKTILVGRDREWFASNLDALKAFRVDYLKTVEEGGGPYLEELEVEIDDPEWVEAEEMYLETEQKEIKWCILKGNARSILEALATLKGVKRVCGPKLTFTKLQNGWRVSKRREK